MKTKRYYCVVHRIVVDYICLLCYNDIEHQVPDYYWDDTHEFIEKLNVRNKNAY